MSKSRRLFKAQATNRFARALAFAVASTVALSTWSQDWPQFLGPTRNGVYAGTNLAAAWPKEGPRVVWQREVGQGFAGPSVAAGKLILFHRRQDEEVLEALDARSGTNLWRFGYPTRYRDDFGFDEGPRAAPTVAQGRIFTLGAEGTIHCVEFATGKKLWSSSARDDFGADKGYFGFACAPLVEGEAVLLNIGGSGGAGIVALHIATGKLLWKATTDEASYSSPIAATLGGRRQALFLTRAGLAMVELPGGKVGLQFPWRSRTAASVNAASPLVIGDLIFLSASYETGAILLRFESGKLEKVWSGDGILSNHYSTCVQAEDFLYGFDGRQETGQTLKCVEMMTGRVRWKESSLRAGTVTLAGKSLLVMTEQGELIRVAASPKSFQVLDRAQILPGKVRAYPAVADGYLYARSPAKLVCVDLRER